MPCTLQAMPCTVQAMPCTGNVVLRHSSGVWAPLPPSLPSILPSLPPGRPRAGLGKGKKGKGKKRGRKGGGADTPGTPTRPSDPLPDRRRTRLVDYLQPISTMLDACTFTKPPPLNEEDGGGDAKVDGGKAEGGKGKGFQPRAYDGTLADFLGLALVEHFAARLPRTLAALFGSKEEDAVAATGASSVAGLLFLVRLLSWWFIFYFLLCVLGSVQSGRVVFHIAPWTYLPQFLLDNRAPLSPLPVACEVSVPWQLDGPCFVRLTARDDTC